MYFDQISFKPRQPQDQKFVTFQYQCSFYDSYVRTYPIQSCFLHIREFSRYHFTFFNMYTSPFFFSNLHIYFSLDPSRDAAKLRLNEGTFSQKIQATVGTCLTNVKIRVEIRGGSIYRPKTILCPPSNDIFPPPAKRQNLLLTTFLGLIVGPFAFTLPLQL